MRNSSTVVLLSMLWLSTSAIHPVFATDLTIDDRVQKSRAVAKEFMQSLKGELQAAMKQGGPLNAIGVCNTKAGEIADRYSADTAWSVGRTSLKTRNPANEPDAWEKSVLENFEARRGAGEDPMMLEHHEIVQMNGEKAFRWMKAIPTQAVCLNCHGGANVAAEVEAKIRELYPEDKARGYEVGDIRGAFTITQAVE